MEQNMKNQSTRFLINITTIAIFATMLYPVFANTVHASGKVWDSLSRSARLNHVMGYAIGKRSGEQAVALALCATDEKSAPCLASKEALPYDIYAEITFGEIERIFMYVSSAYTKEEFAALAIPTMLDMAYATVMAGTSIDDFEDTLRTFKSKPLILF